MLRTYSSWRGGSAGWVRYMRCEGVRLAEKLLVGEEKQDWIDVRTDVSLAMKLEVVSSLE